MSSEEIITILSKTLQTDVKVYRAYNKNHAFFTVFTKPQEEIMHSKINQGGLQEHLFEATVDSNPNHQFKVVSYTKYEAELRLKVIEADMVRDQMPEYMWLLN
jgi:glycine/serine hydroxymethyltransferase